MLMVYKYKLGIDGVQDIEMPTGATVMAIQTQGERPCVWVECDASEKVKIMRRFRTYATGEPMKDREKFAHYVGTYQLMKGQLVFHVYTDRVEYAKD